MEAGTGPKNLSRQCARLKMSHAKIDKSGEYPTYDMTCQFYACRVFYLHVKHLICTVIGSVKIMKIGILECRFDAFP